MSFNYWFVIVLTWAVVAFGAWKITWAAVKDVRAIQDEHERQKRTLLYLSVLLGSVVLLFVLMAVGAGEHMRAWVLPARRPY